MSATMIAPINGDKKQEIKKAPTPERPFLLAQTPTNAQKNNQTTKYSMYPSVKMGTC